MSNAKSHNSLGAKIKKARKEVGLSQRELGEMLKLTDKAVSTYEVDRATPPIEKLREISRITYKPIAYFLDDTQASGNAMIGAKLDQIESELAEIRKLLAAQGEK